MNEEDRRRIQIAEKWNYYPWIKRFENNPDKQRLFAAVYMYEIVRIAVKNDWTPFTQLSEDEIENIFEVNDLHFRSIFNYSVKNAITDNTQVVVFRVDFDSPYKNIENSLLEIVKDIQRRTKKSKLEDSATAPTKILREQKTKNPVLVFDVRRKTTSISREIKNWRKLKTNPFNQRRHPNYEKRLIHLSAYQMRTSGYPVKECQSIIESWIPDKMEYHSTDNSDTLNARYISSIKPIEQDILKEKTKFEISEEKKRNRKPFPKGPPRRSKSSKVLQ